MTTVLITGANRGIGLELARHYAGQGAKLHACCRNPGEAEELRAVDGDVEIHALDIEDHQAIEALADKISGPIDIVIANAGVYGPRGEAQSFARLQMDGLRQAIEVNTLGTLATLKAFLPHVKKAGPGKLVAITSKMGSIEDASQGSIAYRASKTALNMAMCCAAAELQDEGIAVGTLHPGWVRTDMGGPNGNISAEESAKGLADVIAGLTPGQKAPFKDYSGADIPW